MKSFTLPKEFAEKWVAALRGGEYKQTIGQLVATINNQICYCANGVAYDANGFKIKQCYIVYENIDINANNYEALLPIGTNLFKQVVRLNDQTIKSFPEIADWIEENVEFV